METDSAGNSVRFHREFIPFSSARLANIESEIWQLTLQLLLARRTNQFYQNTTYCFHYNRPCMYWPICRSGMNETVAATQYKIEPPHSELETTKDLIPEKVSNFTF